MITRSIYYDVLSSVCDGEEIVVLIGSRQVGKTTCLDFVERRLIDSEKVLQSNILRFNLDIEKDFENFETQTKFIEFLKFHTKPNQKLFVFVDEVQRIKNAGSFFKGIYDLKLNIKLVLTGSSSLEIRSSVSESLAGRKKLFNFYPFSFYEYIEIRDPSLLIVLDSTNNAPATLVDKVLNYYHEYLVFGSYPKVALVTSMDEKINHLTEIYQSYIDKDIIKLLNIGDSRAFKNLLKALAVRIGSQINNSDLANDLNISVPTLQKYLDILEETFIIFSLSPFFKNPNTEIKKAKKYYFYDNGLRNFVINNLNLWSERNDKDQGALLENATASFLKQRLKPNHNLYYWRTKSDAEVDFVLDSGLALRAYEVKNSYKNTRSIKSFIEHYKPDSFYLVNLLDREREKKKDLISVYPWQI